MQTLYTNGTILTMEHPEDKPEALLVEDGRIAALGSEKELRTLCHANCEQVDLHDHTLMPAFIDAHSHITLAAQQSKMADLSGCTDFDGIVETLRAFIREKKISAGELVLGCGYDHNFLKEERHPTRDVLDRVSKEHPIVITHSSAHMLCVNSRMLEKAGITAQTPDVDGGVIGRIPGTNEPDGYFEEAAMQPIQALAGGMDGDFLQQIEDAQQYYLRYGITTVQDGASVPMLLQFYDTLAKQNRLKIDIVSYPLMTECGSPVKKQLAPFEAYLKKYSGHFKIGGYKLVLDGSPQGRSAWLTRPYEGEDNACGYPWLKDEEVRRLVLEAVDDNMQLLAHCNGDAAADQYLAAYRYALDASHNPQKDKLRPVMIHCQTVRDDQLDEMARLHMIPSLFVVHTWYWGDVHRKNLGEARAAHISPAKAAFDRGLVVNFHQDAPVVPPDMLLTVWAAVNRRTRSGFLLGEDQRVSAWDALRAVTINAAYAYGEEQEKGSLRPGKLADLVILDRNPLDVPPEEIRYICVLETIKEGRPLWKQR